MMKLKTITKTKKYYCRKCKLVFESKGKKIQYESSIYGLCESYRANCPECSKECQEKTEYSKSKSNGHNLGPCGNACGCAN